ncbi:MAG: enoyl-CoA hydratase, partial [Bacteroidota bacterium]
MGAEEAFSWGLVNHVCEPEELIERAEKMASKIIKNSGN